MGIFGPGYAAVDDYMKRMQNELANNAVKYNCEAVIHPLQYNSAG